MGDNDDSLPPEVQAEVDAIRKGEEPQEEETQEAAPVEVPTPKPLSRRAQAEQERNAQIEAANRRAEAAEKVVEELRQSRIADAERMARIEQAVQFAAQHRMSEPQQQQRQEPQQGPSLEEQVKKLRKERDKALADGDLTTFNEANEEIGKLHARAERQQEAQAREAQMQQFQQRIPQQVQKPDWVTAIEARYHEVMLNQRGPAVVAAYMNILDGQWGPEKLDKAFQRAKDELGLAKRTDPKIEHQRQVFAGGPTHSAPKNGPSKGKPMVKGMPGNWKQVAKASGVPEEEYIRNFVAMNPDSVVSQ